MVHKIAAALCLLIILFCTPSRAQNCGGVFPANNVCGSVAGGPAVPVAASSFFTSANLDTLCSTNNDFLLRVSGVWQCGTVGSALTSSGGTIAVTTGTSGHTIPFLDGANTWSGTQKFFSPAYFGGTGQPWIDVRSGANSCAVAVLDGVTDDSTAIQCQIDYMATNLGGGFIRICNGTAHIGTVLTVKVGVILQGCGRTVSSISANTDITAVAFDSTANYGGLRDLQVSCYQNSAGTLGCITIAQGRPVILRDCYVAGELIGLSTSGVDGLVEDCEITGYGYSVYSRGANWYIRDKFDGPTGGGVGSTYGFYQDLKYVGATSQENHFVDVDMSGSYTDSLVINDQTNTDAEFGFVNGVFSSPIAITTAKEVRFTNSEFGSSTFTVGSSVVNAAISNSYFFSATAIAGGNLRCDSSYNLTCGGTPTIASGACGATTNGAVVAGSTNNSGNITIGASATVTCTVAWAATLSAAPNFCSIFPANAAAAATGTTIAYVSAVTTGNFVITGSALAHANYGYICK